VKFETTPAFDADYKRLKKEHQATFRIVVQDKCAPACDLHTDDASRPWPASLRVTSVRGGPGVLEMTWSFASPDGRATFELVTIGGELRCRWRRVGDHDVFKQP